MSKNNKQTMVLRHRDSSIGDALAISRRLLISATPLFAILIAQIARPVVSTPVNTPATPDSLPTSNNSQQTTSLSSPIDSILSATLPPPNRQELGGSIIQMPHERLSSADTLSDTKIFVLLAAVVFVFLLALGVAMARVSRNRSRHHTEHIRQQVVSSHRVPETLNKTILDILPVYEVTEKRQLRRIHASCPPGTGKFDECFNDGYQDNVNEQVDENMEYSLQTSPAPKHHVEALVSGSRVGERGGYDIDSFSNLSYVDGPSSRYDYTTTNQQQYTSSMYNKTEVEGEEMEMEEWERGGKSKMPGKWPMPRFMHTTPTSIEPPTPVMASTRGLANNQCYPPSISRSSPMDIPISDRHSMVEYHWEDNDRYDDRPRVCFNTGTVIYHDHGTHSRSRSLDMSTPDIDLACLENNYAREPEAAWLAHRSQPDITRRRSWCSSMATGNGSDGSGLGACPICLEEFEVGDQLRELPCKHRYHVICIDTWLVSRSTCCPYCKLDIRRWYYGPSLEDELVGRSRSAENSEHLSQHAYHQEHTAFEVSDTAAAAAAGVQGRGVRSNRRSLRRSSSRRHGHRHGHGRSGSGRWDRLLLMMGASEMASAGRMPV